MGQKVDIRALVDEVKLNVQERLTMLNGLPAEGDIISLKSVRLLREKLSFTDEEHERLQFFHPLVCNARCGWTERYEDRRRVWALGTQEECEACGAGAARGPMIMWDRTQESEVEIPFSKRQVRTVVDWLWKLNKEKKLTPPHVTLWDKFIGDQGADEEDL